MPHQRIIRTVNLNEVGNPCGNFKRLTGIDPQDASSRFHEDIAKARALVEAECEIGLVYCRASISGRKNDSLQLDSGQVFESVTVSRALQHSDEIYLYVASLIGFDSCLTGNMMLDYFIDTWGSAFAERAQSYAATLVEHELSPRNLKRTHLWSPGQHSFDLRHQAVLFEILKPEVIGCTLTPQYMMKPVKSVSGIMGAVPANLESLIKPCDYCPSKDSCPSKQSGCPAL